MSRLGRTDIEAPLPLGVSLEKPAGALASLTLTESLVTLQQTVVRQWANQEAWKPLAQYGITPTRLALFYGPPGNGKTTACQWLASKMKVPLYRVRSDQLIDSYLGKTGHHISSIMRWLEPKPAAIVLFDEVESIFPSRSDAHGECSRELASSMTILWQFFDRWTGPHLFVLATNMRERLDPALLSRMELQLEFGPPTPEQVRAVVEYWSEILHEYGAEDWSTEILDHINSGMEVASFRQLWQFIKHRVFKYVTEKQL